MENILDLMFLTKKGLHHSCKGSGPKGGTEAKASNLKEAEHLRKYFEQIVAETTAMKNLSSCFNNRKIFVDLLENIIHACMSLHLAMKG